MTTLTAPNRACSRGACADCDLDEELCPHWQAAVVRLRPVVYICGPISDPDCIRVAENLHRFAVAENQLLRAGFAPLNPASDWQAVKLGGTTYQMLMARDEALVRKCADALWQLDGWKASLGALREHDWASDAGKPCVDENEGVERLREVLG